MDSLLYLSLLFDFYGPLLTERQQACLRLHIFDDYSFAEIGNELGISRQAVYDNLNRAKMSLEEYERKLGVVHRFQEEKHELVELARFIESLRTEGNERTINQIRDRMNLVIKKLEDAD